MTGQLYKISIGGSIVPGTEQFVYSQWLENISGVDTADAARDAMAGTVATMLAQTIAASSPAATIGDLFPTSVGWESIEARQWNPATNKQIGAPASDILLNAGSASSAFALPNQTAYAISVRTGTTGRRRWNRFYLPPLTTIATGGGDFVALSVAQAFSDWMVATQTALIAGTPSFRLVKYSPAAGSTAHIDTTFIGTRLDTQRRRANQLTEVRVQDSMP